MYHANMNRVKYVPPASDSVGRKIKTESEGVSSGATLLIEIMILNVVVIYYYDNDATQN